VISLIYYAWFVMEYKSSRIEQLAKKFFPLIIVGLILLEVFFTLAPTVNVRGSKYSQVEIIWIFDDFLNNKRSSDKARSRVLAMVASWSCVLLASTFRKHDR
jgi:hypothetical protein